MHTTISLAKYLFKMVDRDAWTISRSFKFSNFSLLHFLAGILKIIYLDKTFKFSPLGYHGSHSNNNKQLCPWDTTEPIWEQLFLFLSKESILRQIYSLGTYEWIVSRFGVYDIVLLKHRAISQKLVEEKACSSLGLICCEVMAESGLTCLANERIQPTCIFSFLFITSIFL